MLLLCLKSPCFPHMSHVPGSATAAPPNQIIPGFHVLLCTENLLPACGSIHLLLADLRIPFFLQNTLFLGWFSCDISKYSGTEWQQESEMCSNTPLWFSGFRRTCAWDIGHLQKSDPFMTPKTGYHQWSEQIFVLFSVVQTFISKPLTCLFLGKPLTRTGVNLSECGWPWGGENSTQRVCLNTSTVEGREKLLQNLNPVVLHLI